MKEKFSTTINGKSCTFKIIVTLHDISTAKQFMICECEGEVYAFRYFRDGDNLILTKVLGDSEWDAVQKTYLAAKEILKKNPKLSAEELSRILEFAAERDWL